VQVNGTKKWITNGHFSTHFSTAVNTGNGLSMLLIPRGEGVDTKLIKTTYSTTGPSSSLLRLFAFLFSFSLLNLPFIHLTQPALHISPSTM
jgi:hypothetical protein